MAGGGGGRREGEGKKEDRLGREGGEERGREERREGEKKEGGGRKGVEGRRKGKYGDNGPPIPPNLRKNMELKRNTFKKRTTNADVVQYYKTETYPIFFDMLQEIRNLFPFLASPTVVSGQGTKC